MERSVYQVAESRAWRCGACPIQPVLGMFAPTGGLHVRVSGRREQPAHYVYDLTRGSVIGHCPACHAWRELAYDDVRGQVVERPWQGVLPAIDCRCVRGGQM